MRERGCGAHTATERLSATDGAGSRSSTTFSHCWLECVEQPVQAAAQIIDLTVVRRVPLEW